MKTVYQLKNFKAFEDTGDLELAPITVLCGENSIGKSSIIKSLLLLRQSTAERRSRLARNAPTQPFLFNGELTRLGSWTDTVHQKQRTKQIGMRWTASGLTDELTDLMRLQPWRRRTTPEKFDVSLEVALRSINSEIEEFSTILAKAKVKTLNVDIEIEEANQLFDDSLHLYIVKVNNLSTLLGDNQYSRYYPYPDNGIIEIYKVVKGYSKNISSGHVKVEFEGPFPNSIFPIFDSSWNVFLDKLMDIAEESRFGKRGSRPGWLNKLTESVSSYKRATADGAQFKLERSGQNLALSVIKMFCVTVDPALEFVTDILSPMWKRLRYLGPLRSQPQRFYQFDDTGGVDIGVSGEFTVQVLALEQKNTIEVSGLADAANGTISAVSKRKQSLLDTTNEWLKRMDLPAVHPGVLQQSLYELRVGDIKVALPDVGFGVSQVLPIVVEALRADKGDTLILEQPEIHLHPKVQASLADFLISRASDGVKFVIESHSEYLVKRLCRRISEGTFPGVSNLINIVFVAQDAEGVASCQQIQLSEFGEIVNWPVGFFDTQEDLYWTEAALRRRRNKNI